MTGIHMKSLPNSGRLFGFKESFMIVAALAIGVTILTKMPVLSFAHDKSLSKPLMIPPHQLERFTFGYPSVIADSLWLRSIQSFDFCGGHLEYEEYREDLKRTLVMCKKGWIFEMLDAVTRVDPRYEIAYTRGAVGLSVIVSDVDGAGIIFARGVEALPANWRISYYAGYHAAAEMNDFKRAAEYLKIAANAGAPNWAMLLAAKYFNKAGQAEMGLNALKQFYGDEPFEAWPQRAQQRYHELEAQLKTNSR